MYNNKRNVTLNSKEVIIKKLERGFHKRTIFKGIYFYRLIIDIYAKYPDFTINLLEKLPMLTNINDYFRILELIDTNNLKELELKDKIMNILLLEYKQEVSKYNIAKKNNTIPELTMLSKWLPRKKSHNDIKTNFVKEFTKLLYPNMASNVREKIYRKTVSDMTKILDPLDQKLASKDIENINYTNITFNNFKVHYSTLWKNKEKMSIYITKRYSNMENLVKRALFICNQKNREKYNEEIPILENIYRDIIKNNVNKYNKVLSIDNTLMIFDFSQSMIEHNKREVIRLYLLGLESNGKILINKKKNPITIENKNKLFDNINSIIEHFGTYTKDVEQNKLIKICKDVNKEKILLISDKNIKLESRLITQLKLFNLKLNNNDGIYEGNPFFKINIKLIERNNLIKKVLNYGEFKDIEKNERLSTYSLLLKSLYLILVIYLIIWKYVYLFMINF